MAHFFMYQLHTDGSELAYARRGGWAYILKTPNGDLKCSGFRWYLSINELELIAVIQGLSVLTPLSVVTVFTDSNHVIVNAKRKKRSAGPLILLLHQLIKQHKVTFVKIASVRNEAHHLAREAMFNEIRVQGTDKQDSEHHTFANAI